MRHLEHHQVLTDVQHGFRKYRSCEAQLITTCHDFTNTMNKGGQTDAILLDFSKAFDKVHHKSLLKKLCHYGITGNVFNWIESFLSNRSQAVIVENHTSPSLPVLSGVPQGSVLGPILFLIYINDMPNSISEGSKIRLFADDSLLYREVETSKDTEKLQEDLNRLQKWEKDWKMEFHPQKCQKMTITNKKKVIKCDYSIHGHTLKETTEADYLGVTLDNKLSWKSHINKICAKANSKIGFLRRNIGKCSKKIKKKCYQTLVRPVLEYSACVWDPKTTSSINQLEKTQRRACRFVLNKYRRKDSVTKMLKELDWQSLQERRQKIKLSVFQKSRLNQVRIPTETLSNHPRKENSYLVPYSRVNAHLHSYFPSTIRTWNSLPDNIRKIEDINTFNQQLSALTIPK